MRAHHRADVPTGGGSQCPADNCNTAIRLCSRRSVPTLSAAVQMLGNAGPDSYRPGLPEVPPVPPDAPPSVPGTAAAQIAAVYTAQDFQRAFDAVIRDIEIRGHLNTRSLSPRSTMFVIQRVRIGFGRVPPTTRSIRVGSELPPSLL